MKKIIKKDILAHKFYYLLFFTIIICAFLLRIWRIDQLLGFYFDQGRDALVIDALIHGKLTLIGPTTGIEGIFLGPFYYYFLAIGYFLGQGSPVVASYWQTIFVMIAFAVTFLIGRIYFSLKTGLFAIFLMAFSFSQIKLDRWLSNPTPAILFSPLTIFFLLLGLNKPMLFLPLAAISAGILLQLEASSSFILIILLFFLIIYFRKTFKIKAIIVAFLAFSVTLLPQIFFEFKHNFLISKLLLNFLKGDVQTEGQSTFQSPTNLTFQNRLDFYASTFFDKLKLNFDPHFSFLFIIFLIASLLIIAKNWSKPATKIIAVWFYGLLTFFLFYSGNYGVINSYYFIPAFPLFFILIALILDWLFSFKIFKPVVLILLILFLYDQLPMSLSYLSSGVDGETTIALGNQVEAVKYVLTDADNKDFNVDVYVPPVIPYAYTYLFKYYGKQYGRLPSDKNVTNLYTIHEMDISYPERESAWLKRQDGIGRIIKKEKFGGITVEKRERLKI